MTLGLTLSEVKSCVKWEKPETWFIIEKHRRGWRSVVTKRRRGKRIVQSWSGGKPETRAEHFRVGNARRDPWTKIHRRVGSTTKGGETAKEAGKEWRAKGIPQSALRSSVNATLKSAYKSLRRRFPSARGVPIGLKLVRLTAFVPSRSFVPFHRRLFVSCVPWLDRWEERDFSASVAFSRLRIDSIVANIVSLVIVMILEIFSRAYVEMFIDRRHSIMLLH